VNSSWRKLIQYSGGESKVFARPMRRSKASAARAPESRCGAFAAVESDSRLAIEEIVIAFARLEVMPEVRARLGSEGPAPETLPSSATPKESVLFRQAHRSLRTGHIDEALALLEKMTEQYPDGVLVQEREALAIEASSGARRQRGRDGPRSCVRPRVPRQSAFGACASRCGAHPVDRV
jgi:hypothetical protein